MTRGWDQGYFALPVGAESALSKHTTERLHRELGPDYHADIGLDNNGDNGGLLIIKRGKIVAIFKTRRDWSKILYHTLVNHHGRRGDEMGNPFYHSADRALKALLDWSDTWTIEKLSSEEDDPRRRTYLRLFGDYEGMNYSGAVVLREETK